MTGESVFDSHKKRSVGIRNILEATQKRKEVEQGILAAVEKVEMKTAVSNWQFMQFKKGGPNGGSFSVVHERVIRNS